MYRVGTINILLQMKMEKLRHMNLRNSQDHKFKNIGARILIPGPDPRYNCALLS